MMKCTVVYTLQKLSWCFLRSILYEKWECPLLKIILGDIGENYVLRLRLEQQKAVT